MPWTSDHIKWLTDTGARINTADGKIVEVLAFNHQADEAILSAWAKHFRNHYCLDTKIDSLKNPRQSRRDYLTERKFPTSVPGLGPAIRAGDFGEILVADYLEYILKFWVPRVRWNSKAIRDESTKGCDVLGFKCQSVPLPSDNDMLFVFEAKAKFSNSSANSLQDAINDSAKDPDRVGDSLNFIKQKYLDIDKHTEATTIERFQNPTDIPYEQKYGAVALVSDQFYKETEMAQADCNKIIKSKNKSKISYAPHPYKDDLVLLVIKGPDMMQLVHELYKRAANEA